MQIERRSFQILEFSDDAKKSILKKEISPHWQALAERTIYKGCGVGGHTEDTGWPLAL